MLRDNKILWLYDSDGDYVVLVSNSYKKISEFLGKSLGCTYSTVSRIALGAQKKIYANGHVYKAYIDDQDDVAETIEQALDIIYDYLDGNGYFRTNPDKVIKILKDKLERRDKDVRD